MKKDYLEIGKIVNTHGVRGELKVEPWCDGADFFQSFETLYLDAAGEEPVQVKAVRSHGNMVLLTLGEVTSFEQAERLKNKVLYMNRADAKLTEGAYFLQDLIECRILDEETEQVLGVIQEINNFGASDIWRIKRNGREDVLIPNIPDVVREICVDKGYVKIHRMKGLFDDED